MNNLDYGFVRVQCCSFPIKTAAVTENKSQILKHIENALDEGTSVLALPAFSLTGADCGPLFNQKQLLDKQEAAINEIADATSENALVVLLGASTTYNNKINNSTYIIFGGAYYQLSSECVDFVNDITLGLSNCSHIQYMTSTDKVTIGYVDYMKNKLKVLSAENNNIILFTSENGLMIIAENGKILSCSSPFDSNACITCDVDTQIIKYDRLLSSKDYNCDTNEDFIAIPPLVFTNNNLLRNISQYPFIPDNMEKMYKNCAEIFEIQSSALAKRLAHTHSKVSVVGISGGLDSTLALLVTVYAHKKLGKPASDILAITMPGFGTTDRTYDNAVSMMKSTGATVKEISIVDSVTQHFKDIDHDINDHSVTYENAQARERTQILMDIANKEGGIVIGTGDLSEEALGWCTFNGDHISMFGVNAGVPKTVIKHIVKWFVDVKLKEDVDFAKDNKLLSETLTDILDTPISPELLPPDEDGNMTQKTEDKVGPYKLHDFFIFYTVRYGFTPNKILYLARIAFKDEFDEKYIKNWLTVFYKRFFAQQFKRTCSPDSPKIGTIDLTYPNWPMASDALPTDWIMDL